MAEYKVVHPFTDLKDKDKRAYYANDDYQGSKAKKRLEELTTTDNAIGKVLIEEVKENEPAEKATEKTDESDKD